MVHFHIHGYGDFDDTHAIEPRVWPHFDLLYIHDGEMSLVLRRTAEEIRLSGGQGILIYPQTRFRGHSLTPVTRASVQHFSLDAEPSQPLLFQRLMKLRNGYEVYREHAPEQLELDIARAMSFAVEQQDPAAHDMRVALLTLILGQLRHPAATPTGGGRAGDPRFESLLAWMRKNLHRPIQVDDLARRMGLSSSHFRSLFAKQIGKPVGQFLRDLRFVEAARLLRETRTPTKQISRQVGYRDVVTFHHAFKHDQGLTPGEYRVRYTLRG